MTIELQETDQHGLYDGSWKGLIVDEAQDVSCLHTSSMVECERPRRGTPAALNTTRLNRRQVMSAAHSIVPEEWRPVVGWELYYDVSSCGRVRTKHKIGRGCRKQVLSPSSNQKGYRRIGLTDGIRTISSVVHRLVLEAFIGPQPSSAHECNHKNGIKHDNRAENLEWLTTKQNNAHAVQMGLWHPHVGEQHGMAKLSEDEVRTIRSLQGTQRQADVARQYGVSGTAIKFIWQRKNWAHVK